MRGLVALLAIAAVMTVGTAADSVPDVPEPAAAAATRDAAPTGPLIGPLTGPQAGTLAGTLAELEEDLDALDEEVDDLQEPVEEFETFDQCMYLLGVTSHGNRSAGYVYGPGGRRHSAALAIDIRGFHPPQYEFLAFPGEEPPSIECNEDAAGQFTN